MAYTPGNTEVITILNQKKNKGAETPLYVTLHIDYYGDGTVH